MRNTQLNSPPEMGRRCLFVVTLILGAAGLFGIATGILNFLSGNGLALLASGGASLVASKVLMLLGRRYWQFSRLDKQFARDLSGDNLGESVLGEKLAQFEAAQEALLSYQARYREPGYDIMRVQALRQDVRGLLAQDERLREHLRGDIVL